MSEPLPPHVHYTNDPAGKVYHQHPYSTNHPQWYAEAHPIEREAATVPPSDPPGDLRAAVEALDWEGCGGWGCLDNMADTLAVVLALIDAHRCPDISEAALAEALPDWMVEHPIGTTEVALRRSIAAAILSRLRETT